MAIYKYTFRKFLKSYSTWIIIGLTILLIVMLGGYLPFRIFAPKNANQYTQLSLILISTITVFLSIFSSVFSGFKSAHTFKDEVEDGTFLIMISKPIPRIQILINKWLALQTLLILYSIVSSATLAITILVFDNSSLIFDFSFFGGLKRLKEKAGVIFLFVSIILYVMSLIFSSIAILISTKFSVSTTIGISIAMGVIIFVTPLIKRFTEKQEQSIVIDSSSFASIHKFSNEMLKENILNKMIDNMEIKKLNSSLETLGIGNISLINKKMWKNFLNKEIQKTINEHKTLNQNLIKSPKNIYKVSVSTQEKNKFKYIWFLDTYFQINMLSSFVYDEIVSKSLQHRFKESANIYNEVKNPNIFKSPVKKGTIISENEIDNNKALKDKIDKSIAEFDKYIEYSWQQTKKIRADYLTIWWALLYNNKDKILKKINDKFSNQEKIDVERTSDEFMKLVMVSPTYRKGFKLEDEFFKGVYKVIKQLKESSLQKNDDLVKKIYWLQNLMYKIRNLDQSFQTYENLSKNNLQINFWISINKWVWNMFSPIQNFKEWNIGDMIKDNDLYNWNNPRYLKNSTPLLETQNPDFSNGGIPFTKLYYYTFFHNWGTNTIYKGKKYYAMMNRLISAGFHFNKIEEKEYASKYTILAIFTTIAIVLIPIAYLAIRKKDFR